MSGQSVTFVSDKSSMNDGEGVNVEASVSPPRPLYYAGQKKVLFPEEETPKGSDNLQDLSSNLRDSRDISEFSNSSVRNDAITGARIRLFRTPYPANSRDEWSSNFGGRDSTSLHRRQRRVLLQSMQKSLDEADARLQSPHSPNRPMKHTPYPNLHVPLESDNCDNLIQKIRANLDETELGMLLSTRDSSSPHFARHFAPPANSSQHKLHRLLDDTASPSILSKWSNLDAQLASEEGISSDSPISKSAQVNPKKSIDIQVAISGSDDETILPLDLVRSMEAAEKEKEKEKAPPIQCAIGVDTSDLRNPLPPSVPLVEVITEENNGKSTQFDERVVELLVSAHSQASQYSPPRQAEPTDDPTSISAAVGNTVGSQWEDHPSAMISNDNDMTKGSLAEFETAEKCTQITTTRQQLEVAADEEVENLSASLVLLYPATAADDAADAEDINVGTAPGMGMGMSPVTIAHSPPSMSTRPGLGGLAGGGPIQRPWGMGSPSSASASASALLAPMGSSGSGGSTKVVPSVQLPGLASMPPSITASRGKGQPLFGDPSSASASSASPSPASERGNRNRAGVIAMPAVPSPQTDASVWETAITPGQTSPGSQSRLHRPQIMTESSTSDKSPSIALPGLTAVLR